ncbi:hypothetical protein [Nocardioides sp. Arc9.136]|uniref:hypothetical protein n=1 Tax=Nocardioides sp. Arc9.136 TaxID=2996826 RepID=UPI0026655E26|nr:hypothetical protein [Nocardioides sp. Arc9.136]WKN47156.1 hypothetical protein OSR43_14020 [Nocardioides sp. Arc9.136]
MSTTADTPALDDLSSGPAAAQPPEVNPAVYELLAEEQAILEAALPGLHAMHYQQRAVQLGLRVRELEAQLAEAQDAYEQLSLLVTRDQPEPAPDPADAPAAGSED